jgi:hypothetical protein
MFKANGNIIWEKARQPGKKRETKARSLNLFEAAFIDTPVSIYQIKNVCDPLCFDLLPSTPSA